MLLRLAAVIFGILFIFAGVAGFIPELTPNNLLLNIFAVDSMHNIVHIASGVVAIMAATSYRYTRLYFQIFGIVYGLIALLGFIMVGEHGTMLGMTMNMADHWLHLAIAVVSLILGFSSKRVSV